MSNIHFFYFSVEYLREFLKPTFLFYKDCHVSKNFSHITLCLQEATEALTRLCVCAGSSEPLPLGDATRKPGCICNYVHVHGHVWRQLYALIFFHWFAGFMRFVFSPQNIEHWSVIRLMWNQLKTIAGRRTPIPDGASMNTVRLGFTPIPRDNRWW